MLRPWLTPITDDMYFFYLRQFVKIWFLSQRDRKNQNFQNPFRIPSEGPLGILCTEYWVLDQPMVKSKQQKPFLLPLLSFFAGLIKWNP